jgi:enamine deaminase RidA (YjgF/YER057c/UK114 family)
MLKMKIGIFLLVLFTSTVMWAQEDTSRVRFMNPTSVSSPRGYSHASIVDLGNSKMIILSGQVPLDRQGNLIGKGDFRKQAEQVFRNIKSIVTEAGGTMDHIVKLGIFLVDAGEIQTLREVRDTVINLKNPPASTLVEVKGLFRPDVLIEIEATAIIPKR